MGQGSVQDTSSFTPTMSSWNSLCQAGTDLGVSVPVKGNCNGRAWNDILDNYSRELVFPTLYVVWWRTTCSTGVIDKHAHRFGHTVYSTKWRSKPWVYNHMTWLTSLMGCVTVSPQLGFIHFCLFFPIYIQGIRQTPLLRTTMCFEVSVNKFIIILVH